MINVLTTAASARLPSVLALCLGIALVHAPSSAARACSCSLTESYLVWPAPAMQGVSIAPDIVVRVPPSRDYGDTEVRLVGPDGRPVALVERRRELQNSHRWCDLETVFLAPIAPLAPGTRYTLKFEGNFDASAGQQGAAPTFTTGSGVVAAAEPTQVSLHFNRLILGPDCMSQTIPSCPDLADVRITQTAREDAPPTWLRLTTGAAAPLNDWLVFLPRGWSMAAGGSLALASSDDCVAYERIDVSGKTVAQVEVCNPDRCAVLGETNWIGPGIGTCGDVPPLFPGFWEAAGEGSCSAPPRIAHKPGTGELVVTPQATDEASQRASGDSGSAPPQVVQEPGTGEVVATPQASDEASQRASGDESGCSLGGAGRGRAAHVPVALLMTLTAIWGRRRRGRTRS